MNLQERADSFAIAFPKRAAAGAALNVAGGRLHGVWMGGNDFRNKSRMYGAYPPAYLPCVFSLFPDARHILHLFSGSLTAKQMKAAWVKGALTSANPTPPTQLRFDYGLHPEALKAKPDILGNAEELSGVLRGLCYKFDLVIADPPYALEDQRRYYEEAMRSLSSRCSWCSRSAEDHDPVYTKDGKGSFRCRSHKKRHVTVHGELEHKDYIPFAPLRKQVVLDECAKVVKKGGHVVWLDCIWPQHSKKTWVTRGIIGLVRSTTHRIRQITILERQ